MADLSDFQKGQIMGAHLRGASVNLTAQLFLSTTLFRIMTAYTKHGKTSSAKNSGQKLKVNYSANLIIHIEDSISTQNDHRELHKANIHMRAAITKTLIQDNTAKMQKRSRVLNLLLQIFFHQYVHRSVCGQAHRSLSSVTL
uniref:Uncharacterized protein n=1 Tax=Sinocyclocheilus grahami TaxID=75366 RepID=A0A672MR36_SINGR